MRNQASLHMCGRGILVNLSVLPDKCGELGGIGWIKSTGNRGEAKH
jgi:hypothetical protein